MNTNDANTLESYQIKEGDFMVVMCVKVFIVQKLIKTNRNHKFLRHRLNQYKKIKKNQKKLKLQRSYKKSNNLNRYNKNSNNNQHRVKVFYCIFIIK